MADLTTLSSLSGEEATDAQISAILAQIDLDIANLTRDGKLATVNYGAGKAAGGTGRFTNRSEAMRGLLEARRYYEGLQTRRRLADEAAPAISVSAVDDCDCP